MGGSVGITLALAIHGDSVYLAIPKVSSLKRGTIAGGTGWGCKFRVGGVRESWDWFKDIPTVPQKSHDFIDQNNSPREEAVRGGLDVLSQRGRTTLPRAMMQQVGTRREPGQSLG